MMDKDKVQEIGEMGLLDLIGRQLEGFFPKLNPMKLLLGFGDDAAMIRTDHSYNLLVSTDLLVENVHFRMRYFSPDQLGYKSLAVSISDIAAMGGIPTQALIGLAIPNDTEIRFVKGLYNGLIKTGQEYGVQVIGGDTVRSTGPVILAVTILGAVEYGNELTRSGARSGDRIMVTGELGSAMLGLEILEDRESKIKTDMDAHEFEGICRRFLHPIPRVREGRLLAEKHLATSMIDLSDSLSQDLTHICRSSHVGARIEKDAIPMAPEVKRMILGMKKEPFEYALTGGEDFELLFTVGQEDVEETKDLLFKETGTPVYEIGEICPAEEGLCLTDEKGHSEPIDPYGFEHFKGEDGNI
jgi:thiamine-monophosphate kinase